MTVNPLTPLHQCYHFGEQTVDPLHVFTQYLIRNPQYARQRHPDCELNLYVVAAPVEDRLACPPTWLTKVTTTIGAVRAAASAITGEDFNPRPPTAEQLAARRAKKQAKLARQAARPRPA
jgi:hypothetical protein